MRWLGLGLALFALACGPKGLKAQLVNAERRAGQAETALDEADRFMDQLEPEPAGERLEEAREALRDPDVAYYPERQVIRERLQASEKRLLEVREERARRDLEAAVAARRREVDAELARLERAIDGSRSREAAKPELRELRDALEDAEDELSDGKELEARHEGYAKLAAEARRKLERGRALATLLESKVEFLDGPAEAWREGGALAGEAKAEKDRARRREKQADAAERFRACAQQGRELLAKGDRLGKVSISVEGGGATPAALVAQCEAKAEALGRALAKASAKVAGKKPSRKKRKR